MNRIKVLSFALTILFMLGVASAPAWAVELPEFSVETGFKGESGSTTFETAAKEKITCKKATIEGAASSKKAGTFHSAYKECTGPLGVACTGLGDASGVILVLGTWDLVPGEGTMLLLSPEESHFSCSVVLLKLKGTLLVLIAPITNKTKEYELEMKVLEAFEKEDQELTEYQNEAGEVKKTALLVSTNEGTFEEAVEKSEKLKLTTTNETEIKGPIFSITNPLGNRKMMLNKPIDLTIKNNNWVFNATPKALTFSQTDNVNKPFSINGENLTKCKNLEYKPLLTCSVELKYTVRRANEKATLTIEDANKRVSSDTITAE